MTPLQIFPGRPVVPGWAKLTLAALAVVLAVWLVMNKLDQLTAWWPWSDESKLERAETRAMTAEITAITDRLSAEAAGRQVERIETHTREVITLRQAAADAALEARRAPDAETPLDPERAERLRAADQRLCDLYAPACTPAAAGGGAAEGGD